jgi:hypothetical protein
LRPSPADVPYGTLDLMVLKTPDDGALHGYGMARRIEQTAEGSARKQLVAETESWARTVAMVNRLLEHEQ